MQTGVKSEEPGEPRPGRHAPRHKQNKRRQRQAGEHWKRREGENTRKHLGIFLQRNILKELSQIKSYQIDWPKCGHLPKLSTSITLVGLSLRLDWETEHKIGLYIIIKKRYGSVSRLFTIMTFLTNVHVFFTMYWNDVHNNSLLICTISVGAYEREMCKNPIQCGQSPP